MPKLIARSSTEAPAAGFHAFSMESGIPAAGTANKIPTFLSRGGAIDTAHGPEHFGPQ